MAKATITDITASAMSHRFMEAIRMASPGGFRNLTFLP
jgi:hypothetical protein